MSNRAKIKIKKMSNLSVGHVLRIQDISHFTHEPITGINVTQDVRITHIQRSFDNLTLQTRVAFRFETVKHYDIHGYFFDTDLECIQDELEDNLLNALKEFNKRFTSGNSIDVNSSIKVPTSEWRELHGMIKDFVEVYRHD